MSVPVLGWFDLLWWHLLDLIIYAYIGLTLCLCYFKFFLVWHYLILIFRYVVGGQLARLPGLFLDCYFSFLLNFFKLVYQLLSIWVKVKFVSSKMLLVIGSDVSIGCNFGWKIVFELRAGRIVPWTNFVEDDTSYFSK